MIRQPALLAALLLLVVAGCGPTSSAPPIETPPDVPDVGIDVPVEPDVPTQVRMASLEIVENPIFVELNLTRQLSVIARDGQGNPMNTPQVTWSSTDESILRVSAQGIAIGRALGEVQVGATASDAFGTLTATATARVVGKAVAHVEVVPRQRTLFVGESVELFVTLRDANRAVIDEERPITWENSAPDIVSIDDENIARALATGNAELIATVEGISSEPVQFSVEASAIESVRITASTARLLPGDEFLFAAEAYDLEDNLLEDATIVWSSSSDTVATIDQTGLVTALKGGQTSIRATSGGKTAAANLEVYFSFDNVYAGGAHACGLISGVAYCWGANDEGQLGHGVQSAFEPPARVLTALRFVSLSLGDTHTCGLTEAGEAYCWGSGTNGRLGNGQTALQTTPALVAGNHTFEAISAGQSHTCAIDDAQRAWCWGNGTSGRLGNGQSAPESAPVRVLGNHAVRTISAGGAHTCLITTGTNGFCFGSNDRGQLGTQNNTTYDEPTFIPGNYTFVVLTAGAEHTCGLSTQGVVSCFGANDRGQIGDTTDSDRSTPIFVSLPMGVSLTNVSAGSNHTCATAPGGALYCWGAGTQGQIGNGQQADVRAPTRVVGDATFSSVNAGTTHTCAIAEGALYCWGQGTAGQLGVNSQGSPSPVPIEGF